MQYTNANNVLNFEFYNISIYSYTKANKSRLVLMNALNCLSRQSEKEREKTNSALTSLC